jgi:hypothetical protein
VVALHYKFDAHIVLGDEEKCLQIGKMLGRVKFNDSIKLPRSSNVAEPVRTPIAVRLRYAEPDSVPTVPNGIGAFHLSLFPLPSRPEPGHLASDLDNPGNPKTWARVEPRTRRLRWEEGIHIHGAFSIVSCWA